MEKEERVTGEEETDGEEEVRERFPVIGRSEGGSWGHL